MSFAKWLVGSDIDWVIDIPKDFTFSVHSANPIGRDNIIGLLSQYLEIIK